MLSSMLAQICDEDNLHAAWASVARKKSSPGIDRISVPDFARHLESNLRCLRRDIETGRYQPKPLRGFWIPKGDDEWRPVGTPSIRDRVAQRAFLNVAVPLVDARFFDGSHAYRPNRSIHSAIAQVERARDWGNKWVLESDVERCFESIERPWALEALDVQLRDAGVLNLVERWVENPTQWKGGKILMACGIAQGDLISPFLCNVFLDRFDEALAKQGFRVVRYADDFVIPLRRPQRAPDALRAVHLALADLGLSPARRKTSTSSFAAGFRFLGTLFVGALALPVFRVESQNPKRRVRFESGYEPKKTSVFPGKRPEAPRPSGANAVASALCHKGETPLRAPLHKALHSLRNSKRRALQRGAFVV